MARPGNSDERRSQIALALKTVMAVRGYEGATVGEIAREARLAPGLVHYYFDDKLEILRHLCELLSDRMKARAVLFASKAPKKPRAQLVALTDSLLAHGPDEDPSAVAAWVAAGAEALREPRAREAYERVLSLLFDQLVINVRAVLADESRDESEAPVVASALLASVQGYFTLAVSAPGVVPHGTAASALRHMAHGLLDAVPEAQR